MSFDNCLLFSQDFRELFSLFLSIDLFKHERIIHVIYEFFIFHDVWDFKQIDLYRKRLALVLDISNLKLRKVIEDTPIVFLLITVSITTSFLLLDKCMELCVSV